MGVAGWSLYQQLLWGCSSPEASRARISQIRSDTVDADIDGIKLTVVYDNYPYKEGLHIDWGFSCLVEGLDETILFDTGRFDDQFMANMDRLHIDPHRIDRLVISHDHPDHIGGTMKFLASRPDIDVAVVNSFRSGFKKAVQKRGASITAIDQPRVLTANTISTGEMKDFIRNEHALLIRTNLGLIILTGCAHPGVVEIVERAQTITAQEVLLVIGGFHLLADTEPDIRTIASRLKALGVDYVAPTHCSGGETRQIFATEFGRKYLDCGVGRTITARDLRLV
jgi:7,8-dihydropterin-6-yl-methyl-4-(beta-D-ribofuranosyl)aminobenzene 5'-phosphate synthase